MTIAAGQDEGKLARLDGAPLPRMVGDSDLALVRQVADDLPGGARILEFGPWLGGVTEVLAQYGRVHAVDRFLWSDRNAEQVPGLLAPGDSFRPLFEALMSRRGVACTVHECAFQDFVWSDGPVDLCFIDAPRDAAGLIQCLRAAAPGLAPGVPILLKNGLSVEHAEMMALIEVLAGAGVVEIDDFTDQPAWNTTLVMRAGPECGDPGDAWDGWQTAPLSPEVADPWGGRLFMAARLAERLADDDLAGACRRLQEAPEEDNLLTAWDRVEQGLPPQQTHPGHSAAFAEVLAQQAEPMNAGALMAQSLPWALRAWWQGTAGQGWRADGFDPDLIAQALAGGHMLWPQRLWSDIGGQSVLEIGPSLGLSGLAFVAAGASGYLGLETGDLTAAMMRLEARLPPVSYLPLTGAAPRHAQDVSLCLVHAAALEDVPDARDRLEALKPAFASECRMLLLPAQGTRARPYR